MDNFSARRLLQHVKIGIWTRSKVHSLVAILQHPPVVVEEA
jgi:hypothetical protein